MIARTTAEIEAGRINGPKGEPIGAFCFGSIRVIASNGAGWDHVSVSRQDRIPNWEEMESVKRTFFKSGEIAMQLHVPEQQHINNHHNCLHIWRPQSDEEIAIVKLSWGDEWPAGYPDKSPGRIPQPPAVFV